MSPRALPQVARGQLILDGCVQATIVLESSAVQVVHWHCLHDGEALRSERCHTHHVLSISQDGCCHLVDGRTRVVVDPACAVLHRPGATYRTLHPYGCNDSGVSIAFRNDVAEEALARWWRPRRGDAPMAMVAARPMRLALQQLVMVWRHRGGFDVDALAMEELALEILAHAVVPNTGPTTVGPRTGAEHRRIVEDTRDYLNVRFRGPVRLDTIAREVGASPFHLSRLFKQVTGDGIRAYVHRLRLADAVHTLLETDAPVTRIALDSGFASHSHLTASCTRSMGLSPSEIRRRASRAH